MAHEQPADPGGAGSVICNDAGDVTGAAREAAREAGVAGIAAVPGVAATPGAAGVGGVFKYGEEVLSGVIKDLFSIFAPLIRGDINAKMVANIRNKGLVLHMAETGQAGWKKRTIPHGRFNERSILDYWGRLYTLLMDTGGRRLLPLHFRCIL